MCCCLDDDCLCPTFPAHSYVSQNVSYTSAIILKRAVKAKLDLALLLMVCLYTPVVYMLVQACTSKFIGKEAVRQGDKLSD